MRKLSHLQDQFNRGTEPGCTGGAAGCTGGAAGCTGGTASCVGGAGVPQVLCGLQGVIVVLVVLHQPFLFMSYTRLIV